VKFALKGSLAMLFRNVLDAIDKNIICSFSEKSKFVKFSNGCFVHFDDEYWGGDNPYGVEDLSVNDKDIGKVLEWLEYWNEDRDESGVLL
jgi:hypothetical protein